MSIPLFPSLKPRLVHSSWFDVDQPCDDEDEVSQLEREHTNWIMSIKQRNSDLTPIGKTASEVSIRFSKRNVIVIYPKNY
nr:unnamed protein product [Callosobruchus analis]